MKSRIFFTKNFRNFFPKFFFQKIFAKKFYFSHFDFWENKFFLENLWGGLHACLQIRQNLTCFPSQNVIVFSSFGGQHFWSLGIGGFQGKILCRFQLSYSRVLKTCISRDTATFCDNSILEWKMLFVKQVNTKFGVDSNYDNPERWKHVFLEIQLLFVKTRPCVAFI